MKELMAIAGSAYTLHLGFKIDDNFDKATLDRLIYFQETHIGADGVFLKVDGKVTVGGGNTWWALENPNGASQNNWFDVRIPDMLSPDRYLVLDRAVTERARGVREEPLGSNAGPEVLKYGGKKGNPWCCFFVHWVMHTALGRWPTSHGKCGSCSLTFSTANKDHITTPFPRPGDIFIMQRRENNKIVGGHTGFVLRVSEDGKSINTVEGNCANRVKIGLRKIETIHGLINGYKDPLPVNWERGLLGRTSGTGNNNTS